MSDIKVKTGKDAEARTVTVQYVVPENTADFVAKYGEEQTAALAGRAVTLAIQARVRQALAAGTADGELQAIVDAWVPGVRGPVTKKSPLERATAALGGMTAEDLQALLAKVKAAQKAS